MKAFTFGFPSLWLGGKMVVIARTEKAARKRLQEELLTYGVEFSEDKIELRDTTQVLRTKPTVVYYDSGDY